MSEKIIKFILEDVDFATQKSLENTINLLKEKATVPFIARYRKEVTNNLNEDQIRIIESKLEYYETIEKRKETIIQTISDLGKLTEDLKKQILSCKDKTLLEDIYLPYKPKKRTRATIAREKGLEPLAEFIYKQQDTLLTKEEIVKPYINIEKGVESLKDAIDGVLDIIAENISDDASIRKWLRIYVYNNGILTVKAKKEFEKEKTKYEMYYNFEEPIKKVPSHRMLAIRRGNNEKILSYSIKVEAYDILLYIYKLILNQKKSIFVDELKLAIDDSYKRLLFPSIETEIINQKLQESDEEAINVFSKNLHSLLLLPPAGTKATMGVDPGFRTGCKVVVVDNTGKYLDYKAIFPHQPQNEKDKSIKILLDLISNYKVELIAIGNGTASRETDILISELIRDTKLKITKVVVNEAGASVYSASGLAQKEFPNLDVTVRGAISIARRLQDPLAELVKIDPKSIGVGQYQHDVNQTTLKKELKVVIESCVNFVGVELNTASSELLSYVSGIGPVLAQNIVDYRNEIKSFTNRKQLLKVNKLGPKAFEQCAGFLKIRNSDNPLDNTSVHPESYYVVKKMAQNLNLGLEEVLNNSDCVSRINPKDYVDSQVGLPTINDIIKELKKPGRDPREEFKTATFNENITEIKHLKEGITLEGTVTNVTNFGAFVDIGVHQDGLVHISQLSNMYVKDPNDIVKPGQIVKVRVVSVDKDLKRISLSMKVDSNTN